MSRDAQDADAPTLAQTLPERSSGELYLEPGAKIGRYVLERRLGAGAMGVVWAAHDPQLDRGIAIKLVHQGLARSPDAATRLMRDARAMAKLSHRAVITVHDAGDVDGQLSIAMELVDGSDLGSLLRARSAPAIATTSWSRSSRKRESWGPSRSIAGGTRMSL